MKNSKILLPIIAAMMALMMAGIASADTITCSISPTATTAGTSSSYLRGTTNLSVTFTAQNGLGDNASVVVFTNDVTSTVYVSNTSFGGNRSQISNKSIDTAEFTDIQTVTFTATVKNESQGIIGTCTRAYIVDNTVPGCSFASGLTGNAEYPPTQSWTVSCSNSSAATIQFGSNSPKTMTVSSGSCTFTGDKASVPEGNYALLSTVSNDGLNSSTCSLSSIVIDIGVPLKQVAAILAAGQKAGFGDTPSNGGSSNSSSIGIVILVGAGLYMYSKRKGRRK